MIVSLAEDFTINITMDGELLALPSSGLFLNSGTHPSITLENILAYLPSKEINCTPWKTGSTYGIYANSRNKTDLVIYDGKIYQSLVVSNTGNIPNVSATQWLVTNQESLSLKSLIYKVTDKVKADLGLTKRLINSQKIYEIGENTIPLPNDYTAWVFESKGSDYVTMTLNAMFLQKAGTTPVNLYIINQGNLKDTKTLTPAEGSISWVTLDYDFSGVGKWIFAIDSTSVIVGNGYLDSLAYDGFIVYTASGIGATPEDAIYTDETVGNGMGIDITVFKDGTAYLADNLDDLGNFFRATFEYVVFQMFLHNPNNKSNRAERIQMNNDLLIAELKSLEGDTVVARYRKELSSAKLVIDKTNDTQLGDNDDDLIIEHKLI